jgi:hypothetical protein
VRVAPTTRYLLTAVALLSTRGRIATPAPVTGVNEGPEIKGSSEPWPLTRRVEGRRLESVLSGARAAGGRIRCHWPLVGRRWRWRARRCSVESPARYKSITSRRTPARMQGWMRRVARWYPIPPHWRSFAFRTRGITVCRGIARAGAGPDERPGRIGAGCCIRRTHNKGAETPTEPLL